MALFYGFDTEDEPAAVAALVVYAVWRSRGKAYKITPDTWGQVERFVKSSAMRAADAWSFLEALKPRLMCSTLRPGACRTDGQTVTMRIDPLTGELMQIQDRGRRTFLVEILECVDGDTLLDVAYKRTALVIALVRDRIEREKALEARGVLQVEAEEVVA